MDHTAKNRRHYERFDTEIKIYFQVNYDIRTLVKFQVVGQKGAQEKGEKYSALSKNVSAEGLCFVSNKKLMTGDILNLEVYVPQADKPIFMVGEVRWSVLFPLQTVNNGRFDTGVRLLTVNGRPVNESICYDKENQVVWSVVLESVFGSFRMFTQRTQGNNS